MDKFGKLSKVQKEAIASVLDVAIDQHSFGRDVRNSLISAKLNGYSLEDAIEIIDDEINEYALEPKDKKEVIEVMKKDLNLIVTSTDSGIDFDIDLNKISDKKMLLSGLDKKWILKEIKLFLKDPSDMFDDLKFIEKVKKIDKILSN